MPSESIENYLKAIYKLETQEQPASTGRIADRLAVSPPSASRMLKKLAREHLVDRNPYQGVRLTERGRQLALRIIRNHRILESYLVKVLGMSWDVVDGEVERLEHVVSEELINRMEESLGFPRVDPHGSPIPSRDGTLPELDGTVPLSELAASFRARVQRVADASPEALTYLAERGITPGVQVRLVRQEPFHGPLVLEVGEDGGTAEILISEDLARRVLVSPS